MRKLRHFTEICSKLGLLLLFLTIASAFIEPLQPYMLYVGSWCLLYFSFDHLMSGIIALKTGKAKVYKTFLIWQFEDKITSESPFLVRLTGFSKTLTGLMLLLFGLGLSFFVSSYNGILLLLSLFIIYLKS